MNGKKITSSVLAAVMLAGTTNVFAAMPDKSVVIGEKAFAFGYANASENKMEILNAMKNKGEGKIFVKANNKWFNNDKSLLKDNSVIPAVVYTNAAGEATDFEAADGEEANNAEFKVVEISATGAKKITVKFTKAVEDTDKLELKVKKGSITVGTVDEAWNEEKTEVVLTTSYFIQTEDYTAEAVYDEGEKTTVSARLEEAKLADVKFLADKLVLGTKLIDENAPEKGTTTDFKNGSVKVEFVNQYGEDWSKQVGSPTVYAAPANNTSLDGETINIEYTNEFRLGDKVVVNINDYDSHVMVNKTLTVVQNAALKSIELGEVQAENDKYQGKAIYSEKVETENKFNDAAYYIPITVKDEFGNVLNEDEIKDNVRFNPDSNSKANIYISEVATIDEQTVLRLMHTPDKMLFQGPYPISVFAKSSSVNATMNIDVVEYDKIAKLNVQQPEDLLKIAGDAVTLRLAAVSASGKELKTNTELALENKSEENLWQEEIKFFDGTKVTVIENELVELKAHTDYNNDEARDIQLRFKKKTASNVDIDQDYMDNKGLQYVTLNVISPIGGSQTLRVKINDEIRPASLGDIYTAGFKSIVENNAGLEQNFVGYTDLIDQYGDYMGDVVDIYETTLPTGENKAKYVITKKKTTGEAFDLADLKKVKPVDGKKGYSSVEMNLHELKDGVYKIIDTRTYKFRAVDLEDIDSYDVEFKSSDNKLYTGTRDAESNVVTNFPSKDTIAYRIVGLIGDTKVKVAQRDRYQASMTDGFTTAVTTTGMEIDARGTISTRTIKLDSEEKTAKLTVVYDGADKPYQVQKDVIFSDATPYAKTFSLYREYGTIDEKVFTLTTEDLTLVTDDSATEKDETHNGYYVNDYSSANFGIRIKDQYNKVMKDFATYTVSHQKASNGDNIDKYAFNQDENTLYLKNGSIANGDSFSLTAVTKDGKVINVKIVVVDQQ